METVYVRINRFAERLKAKRAEAGLGQIAFAKFLGIAQPTLAKYEMCKREPDLDGLMTICERLNTSPNEMLGFEPLSSAAPPATSNNIANVTINGSNNKISQTISPQKKRNTRK